MRLLKVFIGRLLDLFRCIRKAEKVPSWWSQSPIEFRATEVMTWSGCSYASAIYSAFDPSISTLWIYDYGQQHDQLWRQGAIPEGAQFKVKGARVEDLTDFEKLKRAAASTGLGSQNDFPISDEGVR